MDIKFKRQARIAANAHRSCRVVTEPGDNAPQLVGESFYWTTLSGKTRIRYPSAYKWRKIYHNSSLRVVVGEQWQPNN